MRYYAALIAFLLCVTAAHADTTLLDLHIQSNGNVRFGSGPQLSSDQLRDQIHILMKQNPRPNIVLTPDKMVKYDAVAKVLATFQKEGYGPHFGISGIDQ